MAGVFITGTDTGIGKTTVAAGVLTMLYGSRPVSYWKPIQTGTILGDDTKEVGELTRLPKDAFVEPTYRFPDPVAPSIAARQFNRTIELSKVLADFEKYKAERFLVMEGAGGILVPINETQLMAELIRQLQVPVLIAAENKLGTINQTLLTLDACQKYGLEVLGVVLTRTAGVARLGNRESIEKFGKVKVLAELRDHANRKDTISEIAGSTELRAVFGLPEIP